MQAASGRECEEQRRLVSSAGGKARTWSWQDITFVASLLVQLIVIGVSIGVLVELNARAGRGIKQPEILQTILTLETVVQCIEFAWYLMIGLTYYSWCWSWGVEWRYLDWAFSTPVMLITLFFFVQYLASPEACMTNETLVGQSGFALAIACIVAFDWAMLLFGLSIELKEQNTWAPAWSILGRVRRGNYHNAAIGLGFVALVLAFLPHFIWAGDGYGSTGGWVAILVTLAIWAVYGVVAWWLYDDDEAQKNPAVSNESARNAWYNVLDIFSKNLAGVIISIVALQWDGETLVCSSDASGS
jgi:hypothetical protein